MILRSMTLLLIITAAGCTPETTPERPPATVPPAAVPPVTISPATIPPSTAAPEPASDLNGTWVVVETLRNGEPYPQENGGTCEFDLPTAIVKTPDGTVATYEIKLDADRNPKHIDWITKEQDILRGLYDLQKNTLTTCSPPNFNGSRPEELKTRPGDGRWVFHMRRQTNP